MCRFIAYLGPDIMLEEVLVKPVNSIIMQSLHARESNVPTNGDGFGLGWYAPDISPNPALFTSIQPAWNDRNLLHLTAKIRSPAFFAHVRAASSSSGVTPYNCHPFMQGPWLLMHNGDIHNFIQVKRHLRHLLEDDIYHWIKGETDSEHLFALMMQLAKGKDLSKMDLLADGFERALGAVLELVHRYTNGGPSYFNLCISDGKRLLASRYCSDSSIQPESLHFATGHSFVSRDGHQHMLPAKGKIDCAIVVSEKLTNFESEWSDIPANHLLLLDEHRRIRFRELKP